MALFENNIFARKRSNQLRDEIEGIIRQLAAQEHQYSQKRIPDCGVFPDFDKVLAQAKRSTVFIEKDRTLWESYSKQGGIYDILKKIENATTMPSANAFDFDEDEGCYIIFLTIHNTLLIRFMAQLADLQQDYAAPYDSELSQTESELLNRRKCLLEDQKRVIKPKSQTFRKELELTRKRLSSPDSPGRGYDRETTLAALLQKVKGVWREMQEQAMVFDSQVQQYCADCEAFAASVRYQADYVQKYDVLYTALEELCREIGENGVLCRLSEPPTDEASLAAYMDTAKSFCERAATITRQYPL